MYYFVFLIVRRSYQRMQPWSALPAYLTPTFLCSRTPFTPALACCCFCRLVALSGTMTIWDTGRKRQRWVRRTVEVIFTLAPRNGAQVGYSMGTNVNTPFFKYPRQNITMSFLTQPLKSASSSGASFFAQRRARNACDTRVTVDDEQGPFSPPPPHPPSFARTRRL